MFQLPPVATSNRKTENAIKSRLRQMRLIDSNLEHAPVGRVFLGRADPQLANPLTVVENLKQTMGFQWLPAREVGLV